MNRMHVKYAFRYSIPSYGTVLECRFWFNINNMKCVSQFSLTGDQAPIAFLHKHVRSFV